MLCCFQLALQDLAMALSKRLEVCREQLFALKRWLCTILAPCDPAQVSLRTFWPIFGYFGNQRCNLTLVSIWLLLLAGVSTDNRFVSIRHQLARHWETMRQHGTAWTQQTLQISRYTILTYAELLYSIGDFEASRKCGAPCCVEKSAKWGYWTCSLSIVSMAETWENMRRRQWRQWQQWRQLANRRTCSPHRRAAALRYFSMAAYLDEMNLRALWGLATCNMVGVSVDSVDSVDSGDWDILRYWLCQTWNIWSLMKLVKPLWFLDVLWYSKSWHPWTHFSTTVDSTHYTDYTCPREFLAATGFIRSPFIVRGFDWWAFQQTCPSEALAEKDKAREKLLGLSK